ncbi:MAG TPA: alpha-L-fucosidase, partial [Lacipirellulaceae bacterium]|nr:alpha-L-fucosidase [Lacipirellulaceae bacterium]
GCDPDVLWFDGEWCDWWTEEDGRQLYAYLRELKPALIINNRVGKGRDGMAGLNRGDGAYVGDYGTPEQEIPARGLPGVDWETCMTMNDTWGFKDDDHNWKSVETLVRQLVDSASKGGNYLLNVGPTAEGEIPAASIDRLQASGRWMQANGEAIYGTTASPLEEFGWGRCTAKAGPGGATLYLHVLQWPADGRLVLPTIPGAIRAASLLANGEALAAMVDGDRWTIAVPREPLDPIDTVIKVELDAPLDRKHDATRR